MECLTVLADTLTIHYSAFQMMKMFDEMRESLLERYRSLRSQSPPRRATVASLLDLMAVTTSDNEDSDHLRSELGLCLQPLGIAANTPASEGVMCDLLGPQGDFDDEIERIFASGQSMSGETSVQVLERIEDLLFAVQSRSDAHDVVLLYGNLLIALNALDEDRFERAMLETLYRLTCSESHSHLVHIGPTLVGLGCIRISSLADFVLRGFDHGDVTDDKIPFLAMEVLELLTTSNSASFSPVDLKQKMPAELESRFETARTIFSRKAPMVIIQLNLQAIKFWQHGQPKQVDRIRRVCQSTVLRDVLTILVKDNPVEILKSFRDHLNGLEYNGAKDCYSNLATTMIDPRDTYRKNYSVLLIFRSTNLGTDMSCKDLPDKITLALSMVDDFSAPAVAVGLSLLVYMEVREGRALDDLRDSVLKATRDAISRGWTQWSLVLDFMPTELNLSREVRIRPGEASQLRNHAYLHETRFESLRRTRYLENLEKS